MATQAHVHQGGSRDAPSPAAFIDRWIYVFMAVFLIAVISYLYIEEPQRRSALFARLRSSRAFGRARAAE